MFQTLTPVTAHRQPIHEILDRVALPLMLFSAVLFVLLFVSWFGILPRFTRFAVADVTLTPDEMAVYVSHLQGELQTMEQKRDHLILPINDPAYDTLRAEKRSTMDVLEIRTRLLDSANGLVDANHAVFLNHVSLDNSTQTVTATGDVRSVGPRSMTVLASYTEILEALPFVDHLVRPSFTRVDDPTIGIHSPFTFQFTLKNVQP